ncbi:MAG: hypothetical protein ACWA5R_10940 [bacterium]
MSTFFSYLTSHFPAIPFGHNRSVVKKIRLWLNQLPLTDISNSGSLLLIKLSELNELNINAKARKELLELLIPAVNYITNNTLQLNPNPYFPLQSSINQIDLPRLLWLELVKFYWQIPLTKAGNSRQSLALQTTLGLDLLNKTALSHFQVYRNLPDYFWSYVSRLYQYAQQVDIQSVNTLPLLTEFSPSFNIALKRLILLTTVDPNRFHREELQQVYNHSLFWANDCHITSLVQSSLEPGWLYVGKNQQIQPDLPHNIDKSDTFCIGLDCSALLINTRDISLLNESNQYRQRWIKKAMTRWADNFYSQFPLLDFHCEITIHSGVSQVFDAVSRYYGIQWADSQHQSKASFSAGKSRSQSLQKRNPWSPYSEPTLKKTTTTKRPTENQSPASHWLCIKKSANQIQLKANTDSPFKLRIGQLLSIENKQENLIWIAKLTSIFVGGSRDMTIHCQLISQRHQPVKFSMNGVTKKAILVFTGPSIEPVENIICSPNELKANLKINLALHQGKYLTREIKHCFDSTENYSFYNLKVPLNNAKH